ncbi:hypothetical protein FJW06_15500 [Mesorhizobium sp. B4-1-3]|nr:hypothetical protein FJW06_15500 [Mesorhizobium sp. B4-1-3]
MVFGHFQRVFELLPGKSRLHFGVAEFVVALNDLIEQVLADLGIVAITVGMVAAGFLDEKDAVFDAFEQQRILGIVLGDLFPLRCRRGAVLRLIAKWAALDGL